MPFNATDITETAKSVLKLVGDWPHGVDIHAQRTPRFLLRIAFRDVKGVACEFTLTEQVNCCGILVSTSTNVRSDLRGQGYGTELQAVKVALAKAFGYSLLMCTVNVTGNPGQVSLLEKNGWTRAALFNNSRTKNDVGVFTKPVA